jgi:hypothetical protein
LARKKISESEAIRIYVIPEEKSPIGCWWRIEPPASARDIYREEDLKKGKWIATPDELLDEIIKISKRKLKQ